MGWLPDEQSILEDTYDGKEMRDFATREKTGSFGFAPSGAFPNPSEDCRKTPSSSLSSYRIAMALLWHNIGTNNKRKWR
jgi:hypothetical protein